MGNFIASLYTIQAGAAVGAIAAIAATNTLMPIQSRFREEIVIISILLNAIASGVGSLVGAAIAANAVHTATFPVIIASLATLIALNR